MKRIHIVTKVVAFITYCHLKLRWATFRVLFANIFLIFCKTICINIFQPFFPNIKLINTFVYINSE